MKLAKANAEARGAEARGALAIGALAVGAAAVGGFAIGRLSVGRQAIGKATIGRLAVKKLEIEELDRPADGARRAREVRQHHSGVLFARIADKRNTAVGSALALAALCAALATSPAGAVGPYPDLSPCTVFPDPPASLSPRAPSLPTEAAWNQDISKAPRDPRSNAYISYINAHGGDALHPDFGSPRAYGFPYSVVGAGQRMLPVHYTAYGDESDPGPFPVPAGAPVEGGNRSDGDRHVLVVDRAACKLYELYRAFYVAKPRPHWNADSGTEWDLRSAARRPDGWTSADAAGLPIFPGLVRYDEVASGHLDHAIRVTVESTRNAWVHPASHCAGDTSAADAPPMGLRLRLKAGYPLGGFSGGARTIAVAMKRYGLIVADNGSNWFFSGSSDRRWDDENLNQLKRIPGRAFEAVKSAAAIRPC